MEVDASHLTIRAYQPTDRSWWVTVADRLRPSIHTAGRDPVVFAQWFDALRERDPDYGPDAAIVVAENAEGNLMGLLAIRPDADYFTEEARAYIELLVVSEHAEGLGVGRALMDWATDWSRSHGYKAIALDVFAANENARRFYERMGYSDDFVRMARDITERP